MVANFVLTNGRRIGSLSVSSISTKMADRLLEKLMTVIDTDDDGNEVVRARKTTVNHAMKSCRRAWNVVHRSEPTIVPKSNPFSRMGLDESSVASANATYAQMQAFVAAADQTGRSSIGTAAMVAWEWLQREEHILGAFKAAHYRAPDRPDDVLIVHPKTGQEVWWPLFDPDAEIRIPLFPELMARLDQIKRSRTSGAMIVRDWKDRTAGIPLPWPTGTKGDLTFFRHEVKRIIRAAGLPDNLSFSSFRHGGLTEGGDADMTDREILAQSAQKGPKVLPRYVKKTMRQVANGARKRRAIRTGGGRLSE